VATTAAFSRGTFIMKEVQLTRSQERAIDIWMREYCLGNISTSRLVFLICNFVEACNAEVQVPPQSTPPSDPTTGNK
jgi:hypothetical protein